MPLTARFNTPKISIVIELNMMLSHLHTDIVSLETVGCIVRIAAGIRKCNNTVFYLFPEPIAVYNHSPNCLAAVSLTVTHFGLDSGGLILAENHVVLP